MHDYLRAIGFSSIQTKTEFENILKDIEQNPQMDFITDDGVKPVLGEKSIDFGENIGINVRGEYDEQGEFCRDYYFPYYRSNDVTMNESVSVEKHSDRFSFVGITDHPNIGVSLIFHLLNMVDYVDHMQQMNKDEAIKSGAECMFIEKYPDIVTVYSIGNVSKELCGGPHVKNTSELGHFKIKKEEASSAGVRRIKAILE